jgi:hypothetical protein
VLSENALMYLFRFLSVTMNDHTIWSTNISCEMILRSSIGTSESASIGREGSREGLFGASPSWGLGTQLEFSKETTQRR